MSLHRLPGNISRASFRSSMATLCLLKLGLLVLGCSEGVEPIDSSLGTGGTTPVDMIPGQTGGTIGTGGAPVAGTGGAPVVGTGGQGPVGTGGEPADDPNWELAWRDEFDTFDAARWRRHDHTFGENASYFSYDNVSVADGKLILRATKNNAFPINEWDKPYFGAEVSTNELFGYMRITARIKFAKGQGMVSSLFTYSDDAGTFWNEIDVEYLGYKEDEVQYNLITSKCPTCGGDRNSTPFQDKIGVAPYADFYEYQVTYTPQGVAFKVGTLPTRFEYYDPAMTAPMRIRMNVWPTSGADPFAGTLDPNAIPTQAEYDWIQVERYVGN
jgi:endo-1,3-1,4-beta-glycanase ExoK